MSDAVLRRYALKAMSPHSGKYALARPRLLERLREAADQPLVALVTLAGFGKTSLLVQLRRELLAAGGTVAWLTVDAADEAATFIPALVASVRMALRLDVPASFFDRYGQDGADLSVASELLIQVHDLARPTYVLLDDLHQLGDVRAAEFVYYLINNAPPNFHVVVSSRVEPPFPVAELRAHGLYTRFDSDDLRFRLEDTLAFLQRRFGNDVDIDSCARLHERTEGWPMALQLVTGTMDKKGDVAGAIARLSGASGDFARYLGEFVLDRLAPADVTMLVRASILKTLRPDLCAVLGSVADCRDTLTALEQDTGLVSSVEDGGDIYRLHPLFAEFLRSRAKALPPAQLQECHRIAAKWYAAHDMLEEAADHAFIAGMRSQALDWIESRLRRLGAEGRIIEVLAWLDRLPPEELARRESIQLTAAWACALCYRWRDAERLTEMILARPGVTPQAVLAASIVRSAVAIHCDDYAGASRCLENYDQEELGPLHCNSLSYIAIHGGFPEKARYYQQLSDRRTGASRSLYDAMYGAFAVGLSYLTEGQARQAQSVFRRALERAEAATGWRSLPAAMQAAGLAAACWELGDEEGARAILANRLDLIEQAALPDAVILAYVTLARYEHYKGNESKALDALNSLAAIGRVRDQPRLIVTSLAEQIRQHAIRNRRESCRTLLTSLDTLILEQAEHDNSMLADLYLIRDMAAARVALLDFDGEAADAVLMNAAQIADRLRRGRAQVGIRILRAYCAAQADVSALEQLAEALSLAESFGLVRILADDWPATADYLPHLENAGLNKTAGISPAFLELAFARCRPGSAAQDNTGHAAPKPQSMLSVRELEILGALSQGRSNKEIAQMLDVGPATVKWHLKNLFSKLNAASRRHAVDRARLLGILD